ncbi:RNA deprotection pyrophosphohydrolase [Mesobacillus maritimus]|uniref:RNA deprotection pyrophosphohydrolase n=1 Tax=Mesobacillus maritimus TaxID=1643336 RepID=UPI00384D06D0
MKYFKDINGADVTLSFQENAFGPEPNHVLIICRYHGKWVLTDHKKRGWEFPGGKREKGETLEQAAIREVLEETGGQVQNLHFIGEYEVQDENGTFEKRVYFAELEEIVPQKNYFETNGPVFIEGDILREVHKKHYSFIMKDEVIRLSLEHIK